MTWFQETPVSAAPRKATTTELAAASLREEILAGRYRPGQPLREEEIGARHGLARNSVREALRLLLAEGLATYSSFRGFRVPVLTVEDVEDIYRARCFVECSALTLSDTEPDMARFAEAHSLFSAAVAGGDPDDAFMRDVDFHREIVALSGSPRLVAWHGELMQGLRLSHLVGPSFGGDMLRASVPQHAEVLVALAGSQRSKAAEALRHHLQYCQCALIAEMKERA